MQQKNRGIELVRFVALLAVLIYHCWGLTGAVPLAIGAVNTLVMLGGEIGVTVFFALSGYGIFYSLLNAEKKGAIDVKAFFGRRVKRIAPQYYFCLAGAILIGDGAYLLCLSSLWDIGGTCPFSTQPAAVKCRLHQRRIMDDGRNGAVLFTGHSALSPV